MIILDFDGTMFDTNDSYLKTREMLCKYYNISKEDFLKINARRYDSEISFMKELVDLELDSLDDIYDKYILFYKKYGLSLVLDRYNLIDNTSFFKYKEVVIISNGLVEIIDFILVKFKITHFFPKKYSYSKKRKNFKKLVKLKKVLREVKSGAIIISDNADDFKFFNKKTHTSGCYLGYGDIIRQGRCNMEFSDRDFHEIIKKINYEA